MVLSAAIGVILVIIALLIVLTSDRDVDDGDPEQAITTSEEDVGTKDVDQPDEVPMADADDSATGETTTDEQTTADSTDDQAPTGMADEEGEPADEPMTDAADDSTTGVDADGQEMAPVQEDEPESETAADEKTVADGTGDQAPTGVADEEGEPADETMTDAADDSTTGVDADGQEMAPVQEDEPESETAADEKTVADGTDDQAPTGMADEEGEPADEPMTDAADDSTTGVDADGQEMAPAQEDEPDSTTGETTTDEQATADGTDDQAPTGMADEEDKPTDEPMTDAADDSTTGVDADGQEMAPVQEDEPESETAADEKTVADGTDDQAPTGMADEEGEPADEPMTDAADDSTTGVDADGQEMAPVQEDEPESETASDEKTVADGTDDQSSTDTDETETGMQTDEHSSNTRTAAVEMDDTQQDVSGPRIDLVRVDEQGLTVLAGKAEPGSSVKAILNDQELVDTRVGSDGTFASIFQISEMQFPAELHLVETDTEGIERISSQSLIILQPPALDNVMAETRHDLSTIDESTSNLETTSSPEKVETVALLSSSTGVQLVSPDISGRNKLLSIISYNVDGEVVMSGSGNPGYLVRIYIDDEYRMQARIDDSGTWSATIIGIDDGLHMVRIDQVEEDGTVVGRIELPFQREPQDRVRQHLTDTDFVDERFTPRADYGAIELITVQPGYTLWGISRSRYGLGRLYVRIYEANSNQIQDPDLIYPGQVFHIPK